MLAGTALAAAMHFTWLARIARVDMPLTLTIMTAVVAFHLAKYKHRLGHLLLGYVAIAAGIMLKGPIGLVLPAVVIGLDALVEAKLDNGWLALPRAALRGRGLWWGVPLVLLLTVPWFWWANQHTGGEFFRVFFWEHNIERGLGGGRLRGHPWWFYLPQFASDFLPWTPLLILACVFAWKQGLLRVDPEARLGLIWFVAVFVVLSCARYKRADYLLPAYPGAALFLACVGRDLEARWQATNVRRWHPYGVVHGLLCAVMLLVWFVQVQWKLPAQEPYRDYRAFAAEVRSHVPRPHTVVFFRTEAHALAFHVGRPLDVFVNWNQLNEWLEEPGTHYVVMPPDSAVEAVGCLQRFHLEEVSRNTTLAGGTHERPLALFRAEKCDAVARNP